MICTVFGNRKKQDTLRKKGNHLFLYGRRRIREKFTLS